MEGRPTDDGELFARAQRGDTAAYEEIVQRYQQVAFRTAYVITGSAAEAEASYVPREELPALLKTLERQMRDAAKRLDFETAARLRDRIEALKETALSA